MSQQQIGAQSERKTVLWMTNGLSLGGVESWSLHVARHLAIRGGQPSLALYPANPQSGTPVPLPEGVTVLVCEEATWCQLRTKNLYSIESALPAILIPNGSQEGYAIAARLSKQHAAHIRVVGVCHSFAPAFREMLVHFESVIHTFIAVSEEIAAELREVMPHRAADIAVRPCPVDVSLQLERTYSETSQPLRLIYAGRIENQLKRVLSLVDLARALSNKEVDFHLRIVGSGPDEAALQERLSHLPPAVRARIECLAAVPRNQLADILRTADVALVVSRIEGSSLFMLEAMAAGCVPVSTRVSGTKALIEEGSNGFVVPIGDIDGMASVVAEIAGDRTRLRAVGRNAHATACGHSVESYLPWFDALLDGVWRQPNRVWPYRRLFPWYHSLASEVGARIPGVKRAWRAVLRRR